MIVYDPINQLCQDAQRAAEHSKWEKVKKPYKLLKICGAHSAHAINILQPPTAKHLPTPPL